MAAQSWAEWLSGLVSGLWPRLAPSPGTHEAQVEELRVSALLDKELRKPVGQRDEELVHKLRVERCKLGFKNAKALWRTYEYGGVCWDHENRRCCGAAQWATQRIAASHHALAAFYEQVTQQMAEDLAAAEARRRPVIAAQPTLHLELPEALRRAPPRLDMCSECAQNVQQMELLEEHCRVIADNWRDTFRRRGELAQSAPGAAAASSGTRDGAAAPEVASPAPPPAAVPPAGEALQGQRAPLQQQQRQQQQQHDCGGSGGGEGAEGSPTTPKQQQQPQRSTSDEEEQQQRSSSDEEQR